MIFTCLIWFYRFLVLFVLFAFDALFILSS